MRHQSSTAPRGSGYGSYCLSSGLSEVLMGLNRARGKYGGNPAEQSVPVLEPAQ